MKEQWKDIPDLSGYQGSSLGKIRSLKRLKGPLTLKTYVKKKANYERVLLSVNGKVKSYLVHRLIGAAFIPNPLGLSDIDHLDKNIYNNRANNLAWYSHRDNILKDQGKVLLCNHTDGRVVEIIGGKIAAEKLGVSRRTILTAIKSGEVTRSGWSFKYKK